MCRMLVKFNFRRNCNCLFVITPANTEVTDNKGIDDEKVDNEARRKITFSKSFNDAYNNINRIRI